MRIAINPYLPFALVYFFVNAVALPFGLTWTALLGPFFFLWVWWKEARDPFLPFICFMAPFLLVHATRGVEWNDYLVSFINFMMIFFFARAVNVFMLRAREPEKVFRVILYLNFALCLLAILLYFTPAQQLTWIRQNITAGVNDFPRLKMFTYEASHYATLFIPIFIFYFLQYLRKQNRMAAPLLLLMLFLPLLLSFSFGVLGSLLLSWLILFFLHFRRLASLPRLFYFLPAAAFILLLVLGALWLIEPGNLLFERVANIFAGRDSSAEGRTGDAFMLAQRILKETGSAWFGIGPGQLKYLGAELIRAHYLYYDATAVAIPNVVAETLLVYGWAGLVLRFVLLFILAWTTRVWESYFRLWLFLFMFIYQFTGSYLTNPAEWVIWALAFARVNKNAFACMPAS